MPEDYNEDEIIELWLDSNVYGKAGIEQDLKNLNTARLSTTIIEIYSAISQGKPPIALVERLSEIAGVDADEITFNELLEKAQQKVQNEQLGHPDD